MMIGAALLMVGGLLIIRPQYSHAARAGVNEKRLPLTEGQAFRKNVLAGNVARPWGRYVLLFGFGRPGEFG